MVTMKDVNIADFGIEAITDNGRVQLSEIKRVHYLSIPIIK